MATLLLAAGKLRRAMLERSDNPTMAASSWTVCGPPRYAALAERTSMFSKTVNWGIRL